VPALAAGGGLVNVFVFAARAQTLLDLLAETLPQHERLFCAYRRFPEGVVHLHQLYDRIPSADFSREVLQRVPDRLAVVRVPPCGWSDLGTPSRLVEYREHAAVA
jgi:mannose-1-phosphate guanylyltransferase